MVPKYSKSINRLINIGIIRQSQQDHKVIIIVIEVAVLSINNAFRVGRDSQDQLGLLDIL